MKRIYHHYEKWEDYRNGMYDEVIGDEYDESKMINDSIAVLSDQKLFHSVMMKILKVWKCSAEENLTNTGRNRRAWLGQAACCYHSKVPEIITKKAWKLLDEKTQAEANETATKIIKEWDLTHE